MLIKIRIEQNYKFDKSKIQKQFQFEKVIFKEIFKVNNLVGE